MPKEGLIGVQGAAQSGRIRRKEWGEEQLQTSAHSQS